MMKIDVFTLFPEWFDWFRHPAPRRNSLAAGTSLQCVNFREHTR
jgi:tRNA (guanine37-N1)-methyltransferase